MRADESLRASWKSTRNGTSVDARAVALLAGNRSQSHGFDDLLLCVVPSPYLTIGYLTHVGSNCLDTKLD